MITTTKFIYSFILLIAISGLQCKSTNNFTSQKAIYKSIYIDQFKLAYFQQVLVKGFNNSKAAQELIDVDHSGFTEPILTIDDLELIDSLTTIDNIKMKMDSINRIGRVAEGAEGKHALGFILDKIESKWLDSLANKRYKIARVEKLYNQ